MLVVIYVISMFKEKDDFMVTAAEFQELKDDVKYIRKAVEGNGKKGLVDKVDDLRKWKNRCVGGLAVILAVIGWLISLKPWEFRGGV